MRILYAFLVIFLTFGHSSVGFDLRCKEQPFNEDDSQPYVSNDDECVVEYLVVTNPDIPITSVNGSTVPSSDVTKLFIRRSTVNFIPKNISFFFPNLLELKILDSTLEWIKQSDISELKALKSLNLKGNYLQVLEDGLFEHNPALEEINFRRNRLRFIEATIFYNLYSLRSLDLEENECFAYNYNSRSWFSQPAEYRDDIRNELFAYCQSWETLSNIYKTHFDKRIFELQSEIEQFSLQFQTCDGNLDAALANYRQEKLSSSDLEHIDKPTGTTTIQLTRDEDTKATANGFRVPFANLSIDNEYMKSDAILSLAVYRQQALFLPQNLAEYFPRLKDLLVIESGLCEIDRSVFKGLVHLSTLRLEKNKILNIPGDTFADLQRLLVLDLSFNQIRTLDDEVFASLHNLVVLDLHNNYLTSINGEVLKSLMNLTHLHLQGNRLKFISSTLFTPLISLFDVNLSENECIDMYRMQPRLAEIEAEIIENCTPPIQINCKLSEIETSANDANKNFYCNVEDLFIEYPKTRVSKLIGVEDDQINSVTTFFVDKQSMKYFPFKISRKFPSLKRIEIQQSNLNYLLPTDFDGFSQLTELVINGNNLTSIKEGVFDTVPQLTLLDLSSNHIDSLPSNIFAKLAQLNTLILSNNQIVTFSASYLPRKNHINEFRIDNNELENIETKTVRFLRKANTIDLTGNVCIDLKFVKSENRTRALVELSGEINLNCSGDE